MERLPPTVRSFADLPREGDLRHVANAHLCPIDRAHPVLTTQFMFRPRDERKRSMAPRSDLMLLTAVLCAACCLPRRAMGSDAVNLSPSAEAVKSSVAYAMPKNLDSPRTF